ncbi:GTPase ObgE [candidate division KSB1 bacterium]|nr:GTPase ObgE [candidate division KSB1 bacterium]
MDFIDEVTITVQGGNGGRGCVSFRREKYVPKGGPDGGDGGNGGNVILKVNPNLSTLFDIRPRKRYKAGNGVMGKGKRMHGKRGQTSMIEVPQGTIVINLDTNTTIGDLTEHNEELLVAHGGRGGKGNARFTSSTRQTPDFAQTGKTGEERTLQFQLKLLADVGLVGFPNAGKSTFLSRISAAKPKIADYPFTTLIPQLGIVKTSEYSSIVVADIPGLIEGAHHGKGLGDRFLRHVERTNLLLFLIDANEEDPSTLYNKLNDELRQFHESFSMKNRLIALTKTDLLAENQIKKLPKKIDGWNCFPISSVTDAGIQNIVQEMGQLIQDSSA